MTEIPITLWPDKRGRPPHLRSFRDGWRHLRFMLLYAPNWLFLIPGGVLMVFGLLLVLWLLPGMRFIGRVGFDIHSMVFGMIFTLVGMIMLSLAGSYGAILVSVAFVGLGSAVFHPEASRVARMASGGRYGLAQSIFQVGGNAGSALGPLMAAFIILPLGQEGAAWFALAALLGIGNFLAVSAMTYRVGFPLDDAWIHLTYARNFALHGEWAFRLGEHSAGSTSPLWTALLAIGFLIRLSPYIWTFFLGWVILALMAIHAENIARNILKNYQPIFKIYSNIFK
mgnify:CR=1 FL=1